MWYTVKTSETCGQLYSPGLEGKESQGCQCLTELKGTGGGKKLAYLL